MRPASLYDGTIPQRVPRWKYARYPRIPSHGPAVRSRADAGASASGTSFGATFIAFQARSSMALLRAQFYRSMC
jgi:hypothetical protein